MINTITTLCKYSGITDRLNMKISFTAGKVIIYSIPKHTYKVKNKSITIYDKSKFIDLPKVGYDGDMFIAGLTTIVYDEYIQYFSCYDGDKHYTYPGCEPHNNPGHVIERKISIFSDDGTYLGYILISLVMNEDNKFIAYNRQYYYDYNRQYYQYSSTNIQDAIRKDSKNKYNLYIQYKDNKIYTIAKSRLADI